MDEQERQTYLEQYHRAKEKGVPFFPDVLFKDAVVSLVIFLVLVALAYFVGAPLDARADPADATYTPRPEWYFLFLFQLLKYFPGKLEVVGVVLIPTVGILLLFALPFIDRSAKRHCLRRPAVTGLTLLGVIGVGALTFLSIREAPPPADTGRGDQTAALYTKNCAGCHGPSIDVPPGANLHAVIAQGKHEGMPAWAADLSTDQIDALAGFILSPGGSQLFTQQCGGCHQAPELVAGDPLQLKKALDEGPGFPAHQGLEIPQWSQVISQEERARLLNFLVAPDGQRLFTVNCAPCHGRSVSFTGEEAQLHSIISHGGLHLEMPPWREKLSPIQLDTLAHYVIDPAAEPEGKALFEQFCSSCHGQRVPAAGDFNQAREAIAGGGGHTTMPVWGQVLTPEQLDALVKYALDAAKGAPEQIGQQLFASNCALCHGDFGEGGPNPSRPGDTIVPISSKEFLSTRDDTTLRAIISQGQPTFGMSPFGTAFGGPLDDDQVDAIVAFLRSWEANPPVELPSEVAAAPAALTGQQLYTEVCSRCHGPNGEGGLGPALSGPDFQARFDDQGLFNAIGQGHEATPMIAWGEILTSSQIQQLVDYIWELEAGTAAPTGSAGGTPSFTGDVLPILKQRCAACHGALGGWAASSYSAVMKSGEHAPVVVPGDAQGSLLAQKLLGTQTVGGLMPPGSPMPQAEIQVILDWIAAGAPEK